MLNLSPEVRKMKADAAKPFISSRNTIEKRKERLEEALPLLAPRMKSVLIKHLSKDVFDKLVDYAERGMVKNVYGLYSFSPNYGEFDPQHETIGINLGKILGDKPNPSWEKSQFLSSVVLHELVHAEQVFIGALEVDSAGIYWKGEKWSHTKAKAFYRFTPWEREAFNAQSTYDAKCKGWLASKLF